MSERFINYLANLIDADDPDLLIRESDARRRELERQAAIDPRAREELQGHVSREEGIIDLNDIFNKYCEIVGYTPQELNRVENWEELVPGNLEASQSEYLTITANRWKEAVGKHLEAIRGPSGVFIGHKYEKEQEHNSELAHWLDDNLVDNSLQIAALISRLWHILEYAAGKHEWNITLGHGTPEAYQGYAEAASRKIHLVIAELRKLFGGRRLDSLG